jgi:hypothetical protein
MFDDGTGAFDHVMTMRTQGIPGWRVNQTACFDLLSGIPNCGRSVVNYPECLDSVCRQFCPSNPQPPDCREKAAEGQCKKYEVDPLCRERIKAPNTCVPPSAVEGTPYQEFYVAFATLACGPTPNDAGSDQ